MCSVAASFSLALVRTGAFVPMACLRSALRRSSGFSSGGITECSESNKRKGWLYRIKLQPEELNQLLQELDSIKPSAESWHDAFEARVESARGETAQVRKSRLAKAPRIPPRVNVTTTIYDRNPDVVAEALERAQGICGQCKKPAPFNRKSDDTPYLEAHHKIKLADGGEDTVENAIALCPNCHREAHYGAPPDMTRRP